MPAINTRSVWLISVATSLILLILILAGADWQSGMRFLREASVPYVCAGVALLLAEGKRARKHVSEHSYSLEEFGLEAGEIRSRLAGLFDRFGWEEPAGREPPDSRSGP